MSFACGCESTDNTFATGVPGALSKKKICNNKTKELGVTQNIKLFSLGKATSRTPNCVGSKKLPKAPKSTGITTKKTMTRPCSEIIVKYLSALFSMMLTPGKANSIRINVARRRPAHAAVITKIKYMTAIRLWLVDKTHAFSRYEALDQA